MRSSTSFGAATVSCAISVITSPATTPRSAAAEFSATSVMMTPDTSAAMPNLLRASSVSSPIVMPSTEAVATGPPSSPPDEPSASASFSPSSSRPSVTLTVISWPLRSTTTSTSLPTGLSATARGSSRLCPMSLPSKVMMTSPSSIEPLSTGPPLMMPDTSAPLASARPRLSAISSVTGWMRTPSQPRRVSPNSTSCATTPVASSEGIEKPMPIEPPEGEMIAVLMPTTSPNMLNSGPPELPRLMAASVWMKSS